MPVCRVRALSVGNVGAVAGRLLVLDDRPGNSQTFLRWKCRDECSEVQGKSGRLVERVLPSSCCVGTQELQYTAGSLDWRIDG